jgi:hypothetical protein
MQHCLGIRFAAPMVEGRWHHTVTVLPSGKVLIAGGALTHDGVRSSAELYDPTTGTFALTGSMSTPRVMHSATLLTSGKVLIVGGDPAYSFFGSVPIASAELFDEVTGTFTPVGSMVAARRAHTATLLPSGKVLIVGGRFFQTGDEAEIFDPATNAFTKTGAPTCTNFGPGEHTATLLPSGKVLVAGGDSKWPSRACEIFDPEGAGGTGTFTRTAPLLTPRSYASAVLLPSGEVLVFGGLDDNARPLADAELFDPDAGTFTTTGSMVRHRSWVRATLLSSGQVLAVGGIEPYPFGDGPLADTEIFDRAANGGVGAFTSSHALEVARGAGHGVTLIEGDEVLVTGGDVDSGTSALASTERLSALRLAG